MEFMKLLEKCFGKIKFAPIIKRIVFVRKPITFFKNRKRDNPPLAAGVKLGVFRHDPGLLIHTRMDHGNFVPVIIEEETGMPIGGRPKIHSLGSPG